MQEKIDINQIIKELDTILTNLITTTKKEIEVFIDLDTEDIRKNVNYKHENMKKYTYLMETLSNEISSSPDYSEYITSIKGIENKTKELKYNNVKLKNIMSPVVDLYKNI